MVYSNTAVYGGNEYGKSSHLFYCHFFEALYDAFEVHFFQELHFYTLSKTLIAYRAMQLRFVKEETLLNNTFNVSKITSHSSGINGFVTCYFVW